MNLLIPGYCIVAQVGNTQHIGYASEVEVCGVKMLEVFLDPVEGDDEYEPLPSKTVIVNPVTIYNISDFDAERIKQARLRARPRRKVEIVEFHLVAGESATVEQAAKPEVVSAHDNWNFGGPCRYCNGTGKRDDKDCVICDGSGTYEVPF